MASNLIKYSAWTCLSHSLMGWCFCIFPYFSAHPGPQMRKTVTRQRILIMDCRRREGTPRRSSPQRKPLIRNLKKGQHNGIMSVRSITLLPGTGVTLVCPPVQQFWFHMARYVSARSDLMAIFMVPLAIFFWKPLGPPWVVVLVGRSFHTFIRWDEWRWEWRREWSAHWHGLNPQVFSLSDLCFYSLARATSKWFNFPPRLSSLASLKQAFLPRPEVLRTPEAKEGAGRDVL